VFESEMEESARPICVICLKKGGDVILFEEQTFATCKSILKIRQDYNLNYSNVGLFVSIVFDKYQSPSIKDNEHVRRDTSEKRDYHHRRRTETSCGFHKRT